MKRKSSNTFLTEEEKFLQKIVELHLIFLKTETMNTSVDAIEQLQGLSKRERSKIERLIRSDQIQKTRNDVKSYKRKASKIKQLEEPEPRKMTRVQEHTQGEHKEEERVSQLILQKNRQSPSSSGATKRPLRVLKPFNPSFSVENGEQGLFDYIIGYVSRLQEKTMEAEFEDTSFIDNIQGIQLEIVGQQNEKGNAIELVLSSKQKSAQSSQPFDQSHRALLQRISLNGEKK